MFLISNSIDKCIIMSDKYRKAPFLLIAAIVLYGCSMPEGLEPVSGVEGDVEFQGEWPDSIKAVVVIALDSLVHPEQHLIAYSDPADSGDTELHYFIQLMPGNYFIVAVGLKIDISIFITQREDYESGEKELPIQELGIYDIYRTHVFSEDVRKLDVWSVSF